jgi:hypothetical protein
MSPPPRARRRRAYDETDDEQDENSPNSPSSDFEGIEINADMSANELYKVGVECLIEITLDFQNILLGRSSVAKQGSQCGGKGEKGST